MGENLSGDELRDREIVYANLKLEHKGKVIELNEVVYKNADGYYYHRALLKPFKITERVKVLDVEILARLGFENKNIGFTRAAKSEEQRNKITGAYE